MPTDAVADAGLRMLAIAAFIGTALALGWLADWWNERKGKPER